MTKEQEEEDEKKKKKIGRKVKRLAFLCTLDMVTEHVNLLRHSSGWKTHVLLHIYKGAVKASPS